MKVVRALAVGSGVVVVVGGDVVVVVVVIRVVYDVVSIVFAVGVAAVSRSQQVVDRKVALAAGKVVGEAEFVFVSCNDPRIS